MTRLRVGITVVALLILGDSVLLGQLIPDGDATPVVTIVAIADVIGSVVALILAGACYDSLSYEIQNDKMTVNVGIISATRWIASRRNSRLGCTNRSSK